MVQNIDRQEISMFYLFGLPVHFVDRCHLSFHIRQVDVVPIVLHFQFDTNGLSPAFCSKMINVIIIISMNKVIIHNVLII